MLARGVNLILNDAYVVVYNNKDIESHGLSTSELCHNCSALVYLTGTVPIDLLLLTDSGAFTCLAGLKL